MNEIPNIEFVEDGLEVHTRGLLARGHSELSLSVTDVAMLAESKAFLRYVAAYILDQSARIRPGETLAYGYWLVKFELRDDRKLQVWEHNAEGTEFIPGATLALTFWRDQHLVCEKIGAEFLAPQADRLVVISEGVLEGDSVQGVRYPSPEHMSGWWITTDRYDGNLGSLKNEHLYHLTAARPELARYLALPYGFRFDLSKSEDIWFDADVANEPQ